VREDDGVFEITAVDPETGEESHYYANDVVMGIGTRPNVPEHLRGHPSEDVFHTASYLDRRERCLDADSITVVGSGQSAAEVVRDLLERQPDNDYRLDWMTRSRGFTQTVDAKLGNMIYNPDYTEYFYELDQSVKDKLFPAQGLLYQGIDKPTSDRIYDILYERSIGDSEPEIGMIASTAIQDIEAVEYGEDARYRLQCEHWQEKEAFEHETEVVILGTGYLRPKPAFLDPLEDEIETDDKDRFRITKNYRIKTNDVSGRIFVQHADFHTHGINATDLGMGCYRNAVIINSLVGEEAYPAGRANIFQDYKVRDFQKAGERT
jgi:lysine N6-hydroxylase